MLCNAQALSHQLLLSLQVLENHFEFLERTIGDVLSRRMGWEATWGIYVHCHYLHALGKETEVSKQNLREGKRELSQQSLFQSPQNAFLMGRR